MHFDITTWVDYVRGVSSPSEREVMANHLAEGCHRCSELAALVGRIQMEAAEDPAVPEELVRAARSVFPPDAARAFETLLLPRLAGRLLFEFPGALAGAGARSDPQPTGEVICREGDYTIELRIEREPESAEMALVGQAMKSARDSSPLSDAAVLLVARKRVVARTTSNQFGEFCLVSGIRRGLKLCVQIQEIGRQLEIPLTSRLLGGS